jgi:hypothetical protein
MTINDLIPKLTGVERRGREFIADCPLHPSDTGSLTVRREFGSIELECSKGCPDQEIARAIGLTAGDLFDDDDKSITGDFSPDADDDAEEKTPPEDAIKPPIAYDAYGPVRTNAFDCMPARLWLTGSATRPMPRRLFGPFWLEGEISILFADTGKGKSVLAVQMAEALASGVALAPFEFDTPGQKVLYFDFELSEKMFEARYSVPPDKPGGPTTDHYPFNENFIRAQLNGDPEFTGFYDSWGEYLYHSFDELLRTTAARLVIIDNITYLGTSSKEQSGGALRVMRVLHKFRQEYGLSILVIAHTPKRRFSHGLTINDLQGSKMLSNFADNVFAIGESCLGPDVRYLKHIKPRNSPLIHGAGNVCSYRIEKETNFLCFEFTGFSHEREHLEILSLNDETARRMVIKRAKELAELGMSLRQIAKELGISKTTVAKFLKM